MNKIFDINSLMKPTNKVINEAGAILQQNPSNQEAFTVLNEWRALHALPLVRLRTNIHNYFKENKKGRTIVQRLKRIPTIINKLSRVDVKLHAFQDIGGLRVIVDDISQVYSLQKWLSGDNKRSDFSFIQDKCTDYIESPKTRDKKGGCAYRSLHIIYKYNVPNDIEHNQLKIELQIRTKLQNLWSTAVEVIDIIEKQSIKFGKGSEDWHNFFAIVSSIFAYREKTNRFIEHNLMSEEDLINEFIKLENVLKPIEKLTNIQHIATNIQKLNKNTKYCLIVLDTANQQTNITEFSEQNESDAHQKYAETEQNIMQHNLPKIALLAHADNIKKLKQGYLAYFLDVQEFVIELQKIKSRFNTAK